jgi:hypothetical protein
VAHVASEVPELRAALPATALGKDWVPQSFFIGQTISGTGLRLSLGGYAGVSIGWMEGFEINLMGLVAGIDPRRLGIKLPGWGDLRLGAREESFARNAAREATRPPREARAETFDVIVSDRAADGLGGSRGRGRDLMPPGPGFRLDRGHDGPRAGESAVVPERVAQ